MPSIRSTAVPLRIRALLLAAVLGVALAANAGVIKPLAEPNLSALPAETRAVLIAARKDFDAARPNMVGLYLAEAYAQLGAMYARYGLLDAARAALENAQAVAPEDGRFPYLLGVFALQSGKLPLARDQLKQALALDDNYLPIRYRLTTLLIELGDLPGARRTIEPTAKARTELAPAAAMLGEISLREKRYADAERWFAQALKADPKATVLHARRAEALAAQGSTAAAASARALAGDVAPGYPDPLVDGIYAPAPQTPAAQAMALAADGKHAEAARVLDAALAQQPADAVLLAAYARVEADRGNAAAAATRAEAALKVAPDSAEAHLARGMVWEMAGKDDEARRHYEAAVRADLAFAPARLALGNAFMRAKQWTQAAEQYRQMAVIEGAGGSGDARLAAALVQAGRCAEALRETNTALRGRPRDGGLMQVFVRLAGTCPTATAEERQMAADYGRDLYRQRPDEGNSEALAIALAGVGRADEAEDYEAQAMFEALKRKDDATIARQRTLLERFKAGQRAEAPWPAGHPLLVPPRLAPSLPRAGG